MTYYARREKYLSSFRRFTATGKHGVTFTAYQFLSQDAPGLNVTVPSAFVAKKAEPVKLTKFVAYYMAHAVKNQAFLLLRKGEPVRDYAATVLFAFLAENSAKASETPAHEIATPITWHAGTTSFEEQYFYYCKLDYWPLTQLASLLQEKHLERYSEHFETTNYLENYAFVKYSGIQKLQAEWPQIANEFGIVEDEM